MTNIINGTGGNGSSNISYTPVFVDTDLRVRVLGLAVQNGALDPVAEAERMLAFVEGRSDAPAPDITTNPEADEYEIEEDTDEYDEDHWDDWYTKVSRLLGKTVRVTLATNEDGTKVISEGTLLGFGQGGDFEILEEDGFVHYCWPMLEISLVEESDD